MNSVNTQTQFGSSHSASPSLLIQAPEYLDFNMFKKQITFPHFIFPEGHRFEYCVISVYLKGSNFYQLPSPTASFHIVHKSPSNHRFWGSHKPPFLCSTHRMIPGPVLQLQQTIMCPIKAGQEPKDTTLIKDGFRYSSSLLMGTCSAYVGLQHLSGEPYLPVPTESLDLYQYILGPSAFKLLPEQNYQELTLPNMF